MALTGHRTKRICKYALFLTMISEWGFFLIKMLYFCSFQKYVFINSVFFFVEKKICNFCVFFKFFPKIFTLELFKIVWNVFPISLTNVETFSNLTQIEQANEINKAFLGPLEEYRLQCSLPHLPLTETSIYPEVSEIRVQNVLSKLPTNRASGPDKLPNWVLKEYSYVLALPITLILNASCREQRVPTVWKMANITPLPKTKIVKDPKKDLRPISLTASISKVAEEFIVVDYIKPAVLKVIDSNQYGGIPQSSTTIALIGMIHRWSIASDGNGAVIRSILFDYRKAFDFIDHSIFFRKLSELEIPYSVINWISDFLTN